MTAKIPKAWCPECHLELLPWQGLLDRCPDCGAPLELVDRGTWLA